MQEAQVSLLHPLDASFGRKSSLNFSLEDLSVVASALTVFISPFLFYGFSRGILKDTALLFLFLFPFKPSFSRITRMNL